MNKKSTLFLLLLVIAFVASAQENKEVINVRQRLLRRPAQELDEHVDSFQNLHLMIGGNVYQTEKHVNYAYDPATGRYDFTNEFKYVQPLLNLGDITIVDLKTSFGNDSSDVFSSPDEFALTLKYSGINAVMHANMHTANIRKSTLKRTRDVLNQYDMFHTGAFIDQAERNGNYPLIIEKKGFKVAILNYTKLPSRPDVSKEFVINEADRGAIEKDMRMALAYKPDFIIVYFDWSDNFQEVPNPAQQALAQYAFEKGANLVVGTCPNAPMRIDNVSYYYKGVERQGIVAYSLGNLLASDEEVRNCKGYLIDMELRKNRFTRETQIDDWGIIPVYTYYDTTSIKGKTKVFSVPCSAIESGDIFPGLPYIEKRRVINGAYSVRQMLGASADELQYNLNELIVNNVKETIEITSASLNNKYSMARAGDIIPSPAPVSPAASTDPKSSASLEKIYQQSNGPAEALVQPPAPAKKKNLAYDNEKAKAESTFDATATKPTVETTKTAEVAPPVKLDTKPDPNRDKMPIMQFVPDTVYRIQIFALKQFMPMDTNYYEHLKGYEVYEEKDMIKYVIGKYKTYQACYDYWKAQIQPRYKQSFIVKFVNGKKALK
jgi:poly-gamma-glutamate synthesis protein (capsule biosynthesis protein)